MKVFTLLFTSLRRYTNLFPRVVMVFLVAASLVSTTRAATITVNSTADPAGFNNNITIAQLGVTVTLRDAVNAVRTTGGTHTITFAPALAGQTILLSQVGDTDANAALVLNAGNPNVTNNLAILGLTGSDGVTIARNTNGPQMSLFFVGARVRRSP